MASRFTPIRFSRETSPSPANRSGETKSRRNSPALSLSQASAASSSLFIELSEAADTPARTSWPTWSRISAISGETTSVSPPATSAGSW